MNLENITNINDLPLFLTVSDVSRIIGFSLGKTYDLFHSQNFPSIHFGKRFVISKLSFIEWMRNPKI